MMKPTDAELDILRIIWTHGALTVRQVHDYLSKAKDVRYTTVLRQMQILEQKGYLQADKRARSHVYSAAIAPEAIQGTMVSHLLEHAFNGSLSQLLMRALGSSQAKPSELEEMRQLINAYEQQSQQDSDGAEV